MSGKPVLLCYEHESSTGVTLEPVPWDLQAKAGVWSDVTDEQGVFLMGASAGQPDIPPSSHVPGNRYTLVMALPPESGRLGSACSPYVLFGTVYFREACSGGYEPQSNEILWLTLEEGQELDLGTMVYLEEENPSCCEHDVDAR